MVWVYDDYHFLNLSVRRRLKSVPALKGLRSKCSISIKTSVGLWPCCDWLYLEIRDPVRLHLQRWTTSGCPARDQKVLNPVRLSTYFLCVISHKSRLMYTNYCLWLKYTNYCFVRVNSKPGTDSRLTKMFIKHSWSHHFFHFWFVIFILFYAYNVKASFSNCSFWRITVTIYN